MERTLEMALESVGLGAELLAPKRRFMLSQGYMKRALGIERCIYGVVVMWASE
jgi:hypothetical protein